jgi:N-acetylmuramoyl-L-alanine amidase
VHLRRWIFLTSLLLLLSVQAVYATPEPAMGVFLDGQKLDSQVKAMNKNGNCYINLPFLSQYLNIIVAWDIEAHDLFLKFGKMNIKFYANSSTYYMNGIKQQLMNAPFEKNQQFWMPVQFLTKMGLTIQSQNEQNLLLTWNQNYLLGIESITYKGRSALLLMGTKDLKVKDSFSRDPDRLVLSLPSMSPHFSMDEQINIASFSMVKQVHFDQNDPNTLNIIFDLNQAIGYQLIPVPDHPNQVILVFNYLLKGISFSSQTEDPKILITSSAPAEYQIQRIDENHLIIDLAGATIPENIELQSGDGVEKPQIHCSQLNPTVARIELALPGAASYYVFRPVDNPHVLEIRTAQIIKEIKWQGTDDGGELHIVANGELFAAVSQPQRTTSLKIVFDKAEIAAGLPLPSISNNFVHEMHLDTLGSMAYQLEINLNRFVNYQTDFSADRRQLTVRFHKSPLIGKIIVIDPGHGGIDNGAVGRQIREKDLNLEIAMRLKDLLEAAGAAVILTRDDDYFVGLYERPYLANYLLADLFISVHTNNHPDVNVHGIEVFHYPEHKSSHLLAQDVLTEITRQTGLIGLGVKQDDFVVIREAQMPSILVEVGFLSNFQEENTLKTQEFKDHAAMGIYRGLEDFYTGIQ